MDFEMAIETLEEVSPKHPYCSSKSSKMYPAYL